MSDWRDKLPEPEHPFDEWIGKNVEVALMNDEEDNYQAVLVAVIPQGIFVADDETHTFIPWGGMIYLERAKE